jgi:phenylalanyl-tRNA synthetase beta chain
VGVRVPLEWLGSMVDWPVEVDALAARLTAQGLAVDAVEWLGRDLAGAVVARVVGMERHARADGLWIVSLDAGGRSATVVTGAQNVRTGDLVPWLEPGGVLPDGTRIDARDLRGVRSDGMLLSAAEMALGPDPDGIFILGDGTPGADVAAVLGLPEAVLELDLTPNVAVHCQSIAGVAREVAAAFGGVLRLPEAPLPAVGPFPFEARIEDEDECPRYALGLVGFGAALAAARTPMAVRRRLTASGVRLHGLAVDITNYVMLEMGQPLHAFDADRIRGDRIFVRRARPGESLVTLDGQSRVLTGEQLVIADEAGPIGLAGVMGGLQSEVSPETERVLFEAAVFGSRRTRRSGRGLGLMSEAQGRFEKGVDVAAIPLALGRAMHLAAAAEPGARPAAAIADVGPGRQAAPRTIHLRPERAASLLGMPVDGASAGDALRRLGFGVESAGAAQDLAVTVPVRRGDVELEVDLVEEVGRLVGFDRLPERLPVGRVTLGAQDPARAWQEALADAMAAQGLTEIVTSWLCSAVGDLDRLGFPEAERIRLQNPLTPDADSVRPSLLPGLVRALRHNLDRGRAGAWLFERGSVAVRTAAAWPFLERPALAALAYGPRAPESWRGAPENADFFALRGVLGHLLADAYGAEGEAWQVRPMPSGDAWARRLHPGRRALVESRQGERLAVLGELHPALLAALDLPSPVIYWEWWLDSGPRAAVRPPAQPPRFPAVSRDVAVVLPDSVAAASALAAVRAAAGPWLEDVRVFDVYRGQGVAPESRSLALRVRYRAPDRTLREDDVEPLHQAVRASLSALGGTLRS